MQYIGPESLEKTIQTTYDEVKSNFSSPNPTIIVGLPSRYSQAKKVRREAEKVVKRIDQIWGLDMDAKEKKKIIKKKMHRLNRRSSFFSLFGRFKLGGYSMFGNHIILCPMVTASEHLLQLPSNKKTPQGFLAEVLAHELTHNEFGNTTLRRDFLTHCSITRFGDDPKDRSMEVYSDYPDSMEEKFGAVDHHLLERIEYKIFEEAFAYQYGSKKQYHEFLLSQNASTDSYLSMYDAIAKEVERTSFAQVLGHACDALDSHLRTGKDPFKELGL